MSAISEAWLITGAAGFLGSHVVEQLLNRNASVVALDDLSWGNVEHIKPHLSHPLFSFVNADIRNEKSVSHALKDFQPATIVHLAALHYIPAAVANPRLTVDINVCGTQTLLSTAVNAGVERFWFASTGDVYAPSESPHREEDVTNPFNIYGLSKLQGEQLVSLTAGDNPATHFIVGRLFNLYGARETNPHILPEILKQLRENPGSTLRLGNLWPRRDLTPVSEAARAIIEMTTKASPGLTLTNVGTGAAWSMQTVIDFLSGMLGRSIAVETDPAKVRPTERPHLQADITRLKDLLGWSPRADLRQGLTEVLAAEGPIW